VDRAFTPDDLRDVDGAGGDCFPRPGSDLLPGVKDIPPGVFISRNYRPDINIFGTETLPERLPPERGGDGRARGGPEAVRGGHGFAVGILEIVDKDRPGVTGVRELRDHVRGAPGNLLPDLVGKVPYSPNR